MAFVDHLGNAAAGFGEGDKAGFVHFNIMIFPKVFHGDTDAGLFVASVFGYVDRADYRKLSA